MASYDSLEWVTGNTNMGTETGIGIAQRCGEAEPVSWPQLSLKVSDKPEVAPHWYILQSVNLYQGEIAT